MNARTESVLPLPPTPGHGSSTARPAERLQLSILVIILIAGIYFLREERNTTQGEYIEYLKEDNKRMIEVIERNTRAMEEMNVTMQKVIFEKRPTKGS